MSHAAELDLDSIVTRVIVADPAWAAARFGGTWVACDKTQQTGRYPGIGYRWDPTVGDFLPWRVDTSTGTIWVIAAEWDAVPDTPVWDSMTPPGPDDDISPQFAFLLRTGLAMIRQTLNGAEYVVFGTRVITDDDLVALAEVLDAAG